MCKGRGTDKRMSEIFNWLKRAELEKKRGMPEVSPAIVLPAGSNGAMEDPVMDYPVPSSKTSDPVSIPAEDFTPARMEVHSTEVLNLKSADPRVRDVWDPITLVGEQFRLLRAKLALIQKQRGVKTLLVTSAAPGEGKTFIACGLSGVLAQEPGRRVLLVDADLRRPQAAKDLGVNGNRDLSGLSDVLQGKIEIMDALVSSPEANLFFLPAGREPENPSELLSSPLLSKSLKGVAECFDWIVIDSPPVAALADTSVLSPLCDAVLMIVHSGHTPSKLIKDSIQRIGRDRICGVVMNRSKNIKSHRYYYKYYHHGSGRPNRG
jgi:capsular exopolysaccharide synthesis family protein